MKYISKNERITIDKQKKKRRNRDRRLYKKKFVKITVNFQKFNKQLYFKG